MHRRGLLWWHASKESTFSAREVNLSPESARSPAGGHGNPLQYSCLDNPMERGAWQATVHRDAKSKTQLKWPSTRTRSRIAESYGNLMFNFLKKYHVASKVWNLTLNMRRFILWKNFFTVWISRVLTLEAILAWRVCHCGWLKHIKKICQLLTHSEEQNKAISGMSPSICSYHCSLIYHDTDYYFNLIICIL